MAMGRDGSRRKCLINDKWVSLLTRCGMNQKIITSNLIFFEWVNLFTTPIIPLISVYYSLVNWSMKLSS